MIADWPRRPAWWNALDEHIRGAAFDQ